MLFDYFDMLSGEPVYMHGVGLLRSPKLKDLYPTSGIGIQTYHLYLNFLSWNKEDLLKYAKIMQVKGESKVHKDIFNEFDVITLLPQMRNMCVMVLSFFVRGNIHWDEKNRCFSIEFDADGNRNIVGKITRNNFNDVRKAMLQLNYIGLDKDEAPIKHSSESSKKLWERAQEYLKEQSNKSSQKDHPEYHIGNIVSKLCAAHPSYNLLNICDLTIFQLYDSFFQLGYIRSSNLNERIFSNHGGDTFKFENWLKPILKKT